MNHRSKKPAGWRKLSTKRNFLVIVLLFAAVGGLRLALSQAATGPVYSVRSGVWSDPATWRNRQIPKPTGKAVIRPGHQVLLSSSTQVGGVEVEAGGELLYDRARSVTLQSKKNLIIRGKLTMTPATNQQVHLLRFINVDNGRFKGSTMDPIASDVGLWVVDNGQLNLNGTPKTAWTNLAGGLSAKKSSDIKLKTAPNNWQPGDRLIIAPTQPPISAVGDANWDGFEETAVRSLSRDSLNLTSATVRDHPQVNNKWTAEVGNLTRNVQIAGTASGYSHIFIRSGRPQTIRYVALNYMGAPDKNDAKEEILGRYALHFHHSGNGSRGSLVEGTVVQNSLNHAFVPHASNGITFRDTISYNTRGDAYWWDQNINTKLQVSLNNESSDILIDHALAAKVDDNGNTSLAGFRLSEGVDDTNELRNSVAVGVEGYTQSSGFAWKQGTNTWKFSNNLAHNNKINGIFVWQNDKRPHIISNFDAYYNRNGVRHGAYKNHYRYQNLNLYGNSNTGLMLNATSDKDSLRVDNLVIDGAGITQFGINTCCHQLTGVNYPTVIQNGSIKNVTYGVYMDGGRNSKDGEWLQLNNVSVSAQVPYYLSSEVHVSSSLEINRPGQHVCLTSSAVRSTSKFVPLYNAWETPITSHAPGTDTSSGC